MTFVTILGITEILCSFTLVLEGRTGKEPSRLEFPALNWILLDAKYHISGPLNKEDMADLPLLRTILTFR